MNPISCYVGCELQKPRLSPGPSVTTTTHEIVHNTLAYTGLNVSHLLIAGVILLWVALILTRAGSK